MGWRESAPRVERFATVRWAILAVWMLALMTARAAESADATPRQTSHAAARNVVRSALRNLAPRHRARRSFRSALPTCQHDRYERKRPNTSRNYPRKKRHEPPSPPKIKPTTEAQRQLAQQRTPLKLAG